MCSVCASQVVAKGHRPSPEEIKLQLNGTAPSNDVIEAPLPNPSLQVTADHNLKTVDAPVFAPKAGEVLLHIKATGICG